MMSRAESGNVIQRVYHSIKESVISYQFLPGERLNTEELAEKLRVSATPVRESLLRLVSEDLVLMVPRMGFFMKSLVESEIRDLYEFNQVLLDWSIANIANHSVGSVMIGFPEVAPLVEKITQPEAPSHACLVKISGLLFEHFARRSGNSEISLRVRNINDRLHYVRLCECEMQPAPREQILPMVELYRDHHYAELRRAMAAYHGNSLSLLPNIMKLRILPLERPMQGYVS